MTMTSPNPVVAGSAPTLSFDALADVLAQARAEIEAEIAAMRRLSDALAADRARIEDLAKQ